MKRIFLLKQYISFINERNPKKEQPSLLDQNPVSDDCPILVFLILTSSLRRLLRHR